MDTVYIATMSKHGGSPEFASTARSTDRHGDLRRACWTPGIALAHERGPDLSCYARRRDGLGWSKCGLSHFATSIELLAGCAHHGAVAPCALNGGAARRLGTTLDSVELARASLRAWPRYLHFALTETGLFRTIFAVPYEWPPHPIRPRPARRPQPVPALGRGA